MIGTNSEKPRLDHFITRWSISCGRPECRFLILVLISFLSLTLEAPLSLFHPYRRERKQKVTVQSPQLTYSIILSYKNVALSYLRLRHEESLKSVLGIFCESRKYKMLFNFYF